MTVSELLPGCRIGILGLQGCYTPHARKLKELGCEPVRIVYPSDLDDCQGLIMPGGESTTMLKAMPEGLWEALREFGRVKPIWGICAGSILLARAVTHPAQQSLMLMDTEVVRNAYGAQNESFICDLSIDFDGDEVVEEAVFIRAPVINVAGPSCTVMAEHDGKPVVIRDTMHLATTFHPELSASLRFHQYFLSLVAKAVASN